MPRGKAPVKTIVVSRNPKDTCVSLWHHAREKPEFNLHGGAPAPGSGGPPPPVEVCPDFDDWVKLFLAGEVECGSWFHHTLEWYAASLRDPDVLFLKYEDMVRDPARGIQQVADFIGIGREPQVIARAVENSSMAAMKSKAGVYAGVEHAGDACLREGHASCWHGLCSRGAKHPRPPRPPRNRHTTSRAWLLCSHPMQSARLGLSHSAARLSYLSFSPVGATAAVAQATCAKAALVGGARRLPARPISCSTRCTGSRWPGRG